MIDSLSLSRVPREPNWPYAMVGIGPGVRVGTPQGDRVIEDLRTGDIISTRRGPRPLTDVVWQSVPAGFTVVTVDCGFGRRVEVGPGQSMVVRDWRAQIIWQRAAAAPPAARLVDGETVYFGGRCPKFLINLHLGQPEILTVEGLEFASADAASQYQ